METQINKQNQNKINHTDIGKINHTGKNLKCSILELDNFLPVFSYNQYQKLIINNIGLVIDFEITCKEMVKILNYYDMYIYRYSKNDNLLSFMRDFIGTTTERNMMYYSLLEKNITKDFLNYGNNNVNLLAFFGIEQTDFIDYELENYYYYFKYANLVNKLYEMNNNNDFGKVIFAKEYIIAQMKGMFTPITKTMNSIQNLSENVELLVNEVEDNGLIESLKTTSTKINESLPAFDSIIKKVNKLADFVYGDDWEDAKEEQSTSLLDIIQTLFLNVKFIASITNFMEIIRLLYRHDFGLVFKASVIANFLPSIVSSIKHGSEILTGFFSMIFNFICNVFSQAGQTESLFSAIYTWINGFIHLPFSFDFCFKTIMQYNSFERFMSITDIKSVLTTIKKFLIELIPFTSIRLYLQKYNPDAEVVVTDFVEDVTKFIELYNTAKEEKTTQSFYRDDKLYGALLELRDRKVSIINSHLQIGDKNLVGGMNSLKERFNCLDSIIKEFNDYKILIGNRYCPFVINLYGESRTGKSTIAPMVGGFLVGSNDLADIYCRSPADDFWSGYRGQNVVIVDDGFQSVENLSKEVMELFSAVTNNQFLLNMPTIDDDVIGKKGTPFTSSVIVVCSNTNFIGNLPCVITCPDALYNRIHLSVNQIKIGPYSSDWSHLRFDITLPGSKNVILKDGATFREFMELSETLFINHLDNERKLQERRNTTIASKYTRQEKLDLMKPTVNVIKAQSAHFSTRQNVSCYMQYVYNKFNLMIDNTVDVLKKTNWIKLISRVMDGVAIMFITHLTVKVFFNLIEYIINYISGQIKEPTLFESVSQFCIDTKCDAHVGDIYNYVRYRKEGVVLNAQSWDEAQRNTHTMKVKAMKDINKFARAEGAEYDQIACDLIENKIIPRLCQIYLMKNGIDIAKMNALPIVGNILLCPRHFIPVDFEADQYVARIELPCSGNRVSIFHMSITSSTFTSVNDDAILVDFNAGSEFRSDITKHFISEKDLLVYRNTLDMHAGTLIVRRKENIIRMEIPYHVNAKNVDYISRNDHYLLCRGFNYQANTYDGDCGGVLLRFDNSEQRKILGIHVASAVNTARGYTNLITQEQLKIALTHIKKPIEIKAQLELLDCLVEPKITGNVELLGRVDKEYCLFQPARTQIEPSLLYGCFDVVKEPCVLSSKDKRYTESTGCTILEKQFMKYTASPPNFPNEVVKVVQLWINEFINNLGSCQDRPLLDFTTVLNGMSHLERINPHTSVGLPYVKHISNKGKLDFMEYNVSEQIWKYTLKGEEMLNEVREVEKCAKNRQRIGFIWTALLKDELRPISKIASGNTRAFVGCPMPYTILFRRYFGAFLNYIHKYGPDAGFTVGINPESGDWDKLWTRLLSNSSNVLGYDVKEFDARIIWQLMEVFLNGVNQWYGDDIEHQNVRYCLMHEVCFTFVVVFNTLYMKNLGVPSGLPMTAELDSFISLMYMMLTFVILFKEKFQFTPPYDIFRDSIALAINGDDNSSTVKSPVAQWFNNVSLSEVLIKYGIRLTNTQKGVITDKFVAFEDVEYLKRKIGMRNGMYVPLMSMETIESMVMWIRNPLSHLDSTLVNVEMAQMFIYFYEKETFETFTNKCQLFLQEHGYNVKLKTWNYYDGMYSRTGKFDTLISLESNFNNSLVKAQMEVLGNVCCEKISDVPTKENVSAIRYEESTPVDKIAVPSQWTSRVLQEDNMDISKIMGIPARTAFGTFTTSNTQGTQLFTASLPGILTTIPKYNVYMNNFKFIRCKFRFRLELNGTPFHQGKLSLLYVPYRKFDTTNCVRTTGQIHYSVPQLKSVGTLASYNNVVELETPWDGEYDYVYFPGAGITTNFQQYGSITVVVFTPLSAGSGASTSLNWTLYTILDDVQLKIMQPQNAAQFLDLTMISSNIGKATNAALPMTFEGDAFDVNATIPFAMDSVSNTVAPMPMIRRATSYYNNSEGVYPVNRMDLHPRSLAVTRYEDFGNFKDEMDFDFFKERFTFIGGYPLTSANAGGSRIYSQRLGLLEQTWITDPIRSGNQINANPLLASTYPVISTMMALHCKCWRGTLVYRFEFICTQFHTMKVFIGWQYGANYLSLPTLITPSTIDPTSGNGVVFELNKGMNEVIVRVPFRHVVEWCNSFQLTGFNSQESQLNASNYTPYCNFIGQLGVYVLNPLVSPASVSSTITMNVYCAMGADMEFSNYCETGIVSVFPRQAQLKMVNNNDYLYPVTTFREIVKRRVLAVSSILTGINIVTIDPLANLMCVHPFLNMYRCYKGGLRMSFVLENSPGAATFPIGQNVFIFYMPNQGLAASNTTATSGSTEQMQVWDFILSYLNLIPNQSVYTSTSSVLPNISGTSVVAHSKLTQAGTNVSAQPTTLTVPYTAFNLGIASTPAHVEILNHANVSCDIEVPYCMNTPISVIRPGVSGTVIIYSSAPVVIRTFIAGADDFRTGQFIGVPNYINAMVGVTTSTITGGFQSAGVTEDY